MLTLIYNIILNEKILRIEAPFNTMYTCKMMDDVINLSLSYLLS